MKYLLFVQDNGRGHLSQAVALKEKLISRGHQIAAVIVGTKNGAKLPNFFEEQFAGQITKIYSPYFIVDKKKRGIKIMASIRKSLFSLRQYGREIKKIAQIVEALNPDILINCYEPVAGVYYRKYRPKQPMFCVAHHYFVSHPSFKFPRIGRLARWALKIYNFFTAPRSATRIALSFTQEEDVKEKNIIVCPPLIRTDVKEIPLTKEDFILAYVVNPGYGRDIRQWCQDNPSRRVEAFREQSQKTEQILPNLLFHQLSGHKFIEKMASCSAYVSTGGFESICEAAYLQKDVLMVPTRGQFEQRCNAADAQRAGLAQNARTFDLSRLILPQTKTHSLGQPAFKEWVDSCEEKIIDILEKKIF